MALLTVDSKSLVKVLAMEPKAAPE